MNILLLYNENFGVRNTILISNLTKVLEAYGYRFSSDVRGQNYQLIFLMSNELISTAVNIQKENNIPIVLIHKKSDIPAAYLIEQNMIDYSIMFNDKDTNIIYPSYKRCLTLSMPLLEKESSLKETDVSHNNRPLNLYINIDSSWDDNVLFRLIRTINQLTSHKVTIYTLNKDILNALNSNVRIVSDNNIEKHIIESDIIIGSGYAIFYALLHDKPSIVLGEKGYGGTITLENFKKLYDSFFQGRIGGVYGEYIPERLILEDIEILAKQINNKEFNKNEIRSNLLTRLELNHTLLADRLNLIKTKYSEINKEEYQTPIIFNSDYTLIKSPDRYWVRNRYTKQIYGWYDDRQYQILSHFISTPLSITEYFKNIREEKGDLIFLKESIDNKILTPFIDD